ncbi:MAG TPA: hypothetical protein VNP92_00085 [Actinophytocola sp.]|nr:hypothetical protein [Actinophytocola sp.]
MAALDDCPAVRVRLESLAAASCSLVLFCEYIPHPILDWMRENPTGIYLSDFGLATSPHFDLSAVERDFAERHATHDEGYAAMRLVNWLVTDVCGVPVPARGGPVARNEYVVRTGTIGRLS